MEFVVTANDNPEGLMLACLLAEAAKRKAQYIKRVYLLIGGALEPCLRSESKSSERCSLEFFHGASQKKPCVFEKDSLVVLPVFTEKPSILAKLKKCYAHILCVGNNFTANGKEEFLKRFSNWFTNQFDARSFVLFVETIDSIYSLNFKEQLPDDRKKFVLHGTTADRKSVV